MKKFFYIIPLLATLVFLYGFFRISGNDPNVDASVARDNIIINQQQSDTTPPAGFPYPEIFNFNYANIANMNAGTVGAMYLFGKYYFNRWNLTQTYIYDSTGTNGGPGQMRTVTYVGSIRDLTTDGRYLYGGQSAATLYRLDTNMATLNTFSMPGGSQVRAIAWDPGRKGFWFCGFSTNISCYDTAQNLKGGPISAGTRNAQYGLCFDSLLATDTGFVWVWDQGNGSAGPNGLYKLNATTGTQMALYNFTLLPGNGDIAGGAEICVYPGNPSRKVILLNFQNNALLAFKLSDILTYIEKHQGMVSNFSLSQNFPNPFNPSTTISYTLMKLTDVNLTIYDVLGNKVKTLINGIQEAGVHTLRFDASSLSSGIYFYTITAGDFKDTKKMLLVK